MTDNNNLIIIPRIKSQRQQLQQQQQNINYNNATMEDKEIIIKPKKLQNPVKDSVLRQNLHKELMFNQKTGKTVLNKKTELEKAIEKVKHKPEKEPSSSLQETSEFARVLETRKKLIEDNHYFVDDKQADKVEKEEEAEFLRVHKKISHQLSNPK